MREFKIYPSNLRRHKKKITKKKNRTKFTYVRVNLIFQPSLAPGIELKKVNKSINTGKVSLGCIVTLFSSRENYITVVLLYFKWSIKQVLYMVVNKTQPGLTKKLTLTNNNDKLYCQCQIL